MPTCDPAGYIRPILKDAHVLHHSSVTCERGNDDSALRSRIAHGNFLRRVARGGDTGIDPSKRHG